MTEKFEVQPDGVILHDSPKENKEIHTLWAYLAEDETGEGICGVAINGQHMPLVTSVERIANMMEATAWDIARRTNKKIRLVKFTTRENVREIKS